MRDWIHVEDHCRALRVVMNDGTIGETYNIGANCELTNLEVVEMVRALVDEEKQAAGHASASSEIQLVADRPGHDLRYAVDATKIREQLGWCPEYDFASGIRQTVPMVSSKYQVDSAD